MAGENEWFEKNRAELEAAYLAGADPRAQSGFHGDAARWEALRRRVLDAVERDGDFLDIGCANGHFLECAVKWASEDGHRIEPYGLDVSQPLVDLARKRLPQWSQRFQVGNAWTFEPARTYAFVRTELVYVPRALERRYVERVLERFVAPGGRLIIPWYGGGSAPRRKRTMNELLSSWGLKVAGEAFADDPLRHGAFTDVAWLDKA